MAVGGSGKTPLVAHVARLLQDAGHRPAILTRGYARARPSDGVTVVSDGERVLADLDRAGDEPLMLARRLPGVPVLVSSDRYLSGRLAERRFGCSVHLLDDGFQHFQLERDVDLVVVSGADLARPATLPSGRLREPLDALRDASAVVLADVEPAEDEAAVRALGALGVEIAFRLARESGSPQPIDRGRSIRAARGRHARSGGGRPRAAGAVLRRRRRGTGGRWRARWRFATTTATRDATSPASAAAMRGAGAAMVVTTEKDVVRMLPLRPLPVPVAWLPLSVRRRAGGRVRGVAGRAGSGVEAGRRPVVTTDDRTRLTATGSACVIASNTCSWPPWPSASGTCRGGRSACRAGRWGSLFYALDAQRRRVALDNLARAFPGRPAAERRRIARGVFRHFGRLLFELLKFSALAPDEMLARVEFEGDERVRQAYAAGRGVFFLTAHFGCWETHGLVHACSLAPMGVMARPLDNPLLHDLLERVRQCTGNFVIYRKGGIRRTLRALESGQGVGMLIDQHIHGPDAIYVDFFDRPAATTTALAALALRTGAPVIPVFAVPTAPAAATA